MNAYSLRRIGQGVSSLLLAVFLVAAPPVFLIRLVGWPLPTAIPGLDVINNAVRSGIADQTIINVLAVIAWIVWAQLAVSILAEALAVSRRRPAVRLPVLPGFQGVATHLVAGVLMLMPGAPSAYAQPLEAMTSVHMARTVTEFAPAQEPAAPVTTKRQPPETIHEDGVTTDTEYAPAIRPLEQQTVVVQRHDSYWAIAERTLGDGFRWKEIRDLNVGRVLSDGSVIGSDDTTLHAGWDLVLPIDAGRSESTTALGQSQLDSDVAESESEPSPVPETDPVADATSVIVEPGDNLWSLSQARLQADLARPVSDEDVAPYWLEVIDANSERYVETGNPNLIFPGQVIDLPPTHIAGAENAVPAEPEASSTDRTSDSEAASPRLDIQHLPPGEEEQPASAPIPPSAKDDSVNQSDIRPPSESREGDVAAPDVDTNDDSDPVGEHRTNTKALVVGSLSSLVIAVGLKRLIDRRRRRLANRRPGVIPRPTPPEQQELHKTIAAQADQEAVDCLQELISLLASDLVANPSSPSPLLIRHAVDAVEVLVDRPATSPPPGWASSADGRIWTLTGPLDHPEPNATDSTLRPVPLLVTIGEPEPDAQIYLNLETEPLIAVVGDQEVADNLVRSMIVELAMSPLADALRIIVIGDLLGEHADVFDHVVSVESWVDVEEDVRTWAEQSHGAFVENDWANAFIARVTEPHHDALVPLVVVAEEAPSAGMIDKLRSNSPSTVSVVVVGETESADLTIRCTSEELMLSTVDIACTPQQMPSSELADVAELLRLADESEANPRVDGYDAGDTQITADEDYLPSDDDKQPGEVALEDDTDAEDRSECEVVGSRPPEYDVLVRFLGDIRVEGGAPLKPKATAVAAYIAMNRSVSTERLEEACWFGTEGVSHRKRLRDTMTEIRSAVGSQYFPANRGGVYRSGPRVMTDLDVFDWHVAQAEQSTNDDAIVHYELALAVVTGRPFTYANASRRSFTWVDVEHHAVVWENRIIAVVETYAQVLHGTGLHARAIDTLGRVVAHFPLCEPMVEVLMAAHIEIGDRQAAVSIYRKYVIALDAADLGDPSELITDMYNTIAS